MATKSNYLKNKITDLIFRGQAYTPPATLYFALWTDNTDDPDPLAEVDAPSYARAAFTRSLANFSGTQGPGTTDPSDGTGFASNNIAIAFPAPAEDWGDVVGVAVYDAPTGGNLLIYTYLFETKTITAGSPAPVFEPDSFSYNDDNS